MKIVYTKHAKRKFDFLEELGWRLTPDDIKQGVEEPESVQSGYSGTKAAVKSISKTHHLRVIYSQERDIITVVTFYVVRKGRYDKK